MRGSLLKAVDAVNESFFYNRTIPVPEVKKIVRLIESRLGKPGSYKGMPAPTEQDFKDGIRLFTGETPAPRSAQHILGEEACRALLLLEGKRARPVLAPAWERMGALLSGYDRSRMKYPDFFCCPKCTCGLLRHLSAGGLPKQEAWLERGLKGVRSMRDNRGGWRMFPFHYTLFTLLEIDSPAARKELDYAARCCETEAMKKVSANNPYAQRRRDVAIKALGRL